MINAIRHSFSLRRSVWAICTLVAGVVLLLPGTSRAQVSGSGTAGKIAKWNGTTTLGDSAISESSGKIGIGILNPLSKFVLNANSATPPSVPPDTLAHFAQVDGTVNRLLLDSFGTGINLTMRMARGTAAAPSGLVTGDVFGAIAGFGYGATGYTTTARAQIAFSAAENWTDSANGAHITFKTTPVGSTVLADRMRIDSEGNVGIGTTTPGSKLEVAGDLMLKAPMPAYFMYDAAGFTNARLFNFWNSSGLVLGRWVNDANDDVVAENIAFKNNGNVGIGTTNPVARLDVGLGHLHVAGTCTPGVPDVQGAYFSWNQLCGTGETDFINHKGGGTGGFAFMNTANGSSLSTLMLITGAGDVGIGTASPTAKLHVAGTATVSGAVATGAITANGNVAVTGDVTVTGNIAAKYQDVAEWVPARESLSPGTVVVIDHERPNGVIPCGNSYDTRVAGVISARPGLILGEAGKDKVMVATTGRVRVKVDATKAPIRVGDLLVTSDTEGIAMRSEPVEISGIKMHRPGTIIGKALEPLAGGVGEILVLLSLQ